VPNCICNGADPIRANEMTMSRYPLTADAKSLRTRGIAKGTVPARWGLGVGSSNLPAPINKTK